MIINHNCCIKLVPLVIFTHFTVIRKTARQFCGYQTQCSEYSEILLKIRPLAHWDCGFESHQGHGCLSVVSVVCCQVEVSAMVWSLVQRSPTDSGHRCVWSRNLENEEAKARCQAVSIQPQWVVTPGKQTNSWSHFHLNPPSCRYDKNVTFSVNVWGF